MLMTKGSFSCKQSMIYGHRTNSCKQKPTRSSEQQLGSFLAAVRLHFLSIHAKVFRTAISSVLIWVCSPTGLAKPFIILRATLELCSSVSGSFCKQPLARLSPFHQMRGRYSSFWGSAIHPSVGCFAFSLQVWRQKGNVISHASFVIR